MKKRIIALFLAIVTIISVCSMATQSVFAASDPNESKAMSLISQYVEFLDAGKLENITDLLCEEEKEEFVEFINSDSNREDHIGYFNYKNVEIVEIKEYDGNAEGIGYKLENYASVSNVCCYEVILNIQNYENNEYLIAGSNKYFFVIGYDFEGEAKLIGMARDRIWSEEANINNSAIVPYGYDTPVSAPSSGLWSKPSTIKVQGYGSVNFKTYCYNVTTNEFGYDSYNDNARKAVAVAVTGYGWNRTLVQKYSGQGFDVKADENDQKYTGTSYSDKVKSAVDATWNYMMLTSDRKLFCSFHLKNISWSSYARQYGGILSQDEAEVKGKDGLSWQAILHYYYDRVSSKTYYNKEVTTGAIKIISMSHAATGSTYKSDVNNHWIVCTTCGCIHTKTSHSFVLNSSKTKYVCSVCGYTTSYTQGVASVEEQM